jgi:protein O-GlcNAc transferase
MEPHFHKNDKGLFYKYLNLSKNYFEFGSGGSTYQASIRQNIEKIYSIESDKHWFHLLKTKIEEKNINNEKVNLILIDLQCKLNDWGNPGNNSSMNDWKKYSNAIYDLNADIRQKLDLILIDGRFRVACCLKCFNVISENCLIIFDDFLNRKHYHIVLKYYDIIERTGDNVMVILKKKTNCIPPTNEIIEKYELIKD